MNYTITIALIILSLTVILSSCKDSPINPVDQAQISLSLEDASCTEAWVKLSTADLALPTDVDLYRDSSLAATINLSTTDTLLYIDSLLPNQTYNFRSIIQSANQSITSDPLTVTTMDTTSHNFTWQTWTFGGQAGTCTLYDVAIINENDIWAVGAVYVADTSQNGYTLYNAVHWDGSNWELKRLNMHSSCNPVTFPPLKAICAFSDSDIIVTSGGSIGWFNGVINTPDCSIRPLLTGSINKIWGVSSDNYYTVGNNGFIAHYQNGQWSRIESGTDLNIGDIWGVPDGNVGYNKYLAADNYMLIVNAENNLQTINAEPGHSLSSIWGKTNRLIYTAGGYGLSLYKNYKWEKINRADVNTIYCIRGSDYNNVFGLSSTYSILHFNGYTWQYILPAANNIYYRLDVKSNVIAAVGWQGNKAVVTLIKRNN